MEKIKKSNILPRIFPFPCLKKLPEFSPNINPEDVISLRGDALKKAELLKNYKGRYLDSENSCIQFGKMQPDGNTVYSPEIIKPFIKYIINHAELDDEGKGKVVIQLWPELAQSLSQGDGKKVLAFNQEKKIIENLIEECIKECGEEGKNVKIEIQNVADKYSDVFDALKVKPEGERRFGIIPEKEPKLEDFELPLKSPLPIIQYLAYHYTGNGDKNLKTLFYETKPAKYKDQDGEHHEPGTSDADYYSIVEVGIRLFEVLNGKYIQGGIDRQKVYDKIIYLILFGEDKISGEKLKLEDYPKLGELHNRLMKCENYKDSKMMQLYIDLGKVENETEKQKSKREKEQSERKKRFKSGLIKYGTILALAGVLGLGGQQVSKIYNEFKNKKEIEKTEAEKEQYLEKCGKESPLYLMRNYDLNNMRRYQDEQRKILRSRYDISRYDTKYYNKILKEYDDAFDVNYNLNHTWLSAGAFIEAYGEKLAKDYNFFPEDFDENPKEDEKE